MTGHHRLCIIRYGTREARRSDHFLDYGLYREPDVRMDIDYFFWVLTGPDGVVVVDSGYSRAVGDARGRTTLIDPADALARLGIEPAQVDTVVVTHAHYDHVGNLALFPNARLVVARSEVEFWRSRTAGHVQFAAHVEQDDIDELARAERQGRLTTFSGRIEPVPGVMVTEVGGHTPGQSIVEFGTREGPVLLASDAVHFHEEFERSMPFSVVTDLPGMYAAYEHVRARLVDTGAHLVTGHDTDTLRRVRRHDGPAGEFVGVIG